MESYTPIAAPVTSTVNAEDAALAALANRDNKRKLPSSYQQVTLPISTLTNDIVIQYPSTYVHDITGPKLQDTETPSSGNSAQDISVDQQQSNTPIPPGQRIQSHRSRRLRSKRRRQGAVPPPEEGERPVRRRPSQEGHATSERRTDSQRGER